MNFIDLKEQYRRYREEIDEAIGRVLASAQFIMGPEVAALEQELASHAGTKHAIVCSSGTDALLLALMAYGVQPGDEVIVPDFTFFATAEVVALLGATPVFVDIVRGTYDIDVDALSRHCTRRTKGIIAVSLFGQCAPLEEISRVARAHDLWVVEDAAQSFGASCPAGRSGALTEVACTSFYPAKPLGAYGDGGAMLTSSDEIAARVRMLLNHGQVKTYQHQLVGINGRLDAIQAAVLRVKLRHFDEELRARQAVADAYTGKLRGIVDTPTIRRDYRSVWAQYTIRSPRRDPIATFLKEKGIPTAIHYPAPLHVQPALSRYAGEGESWPEAQAASREVLSLPMHPFLSTEDIESVTRSIAEAVRE